MLHVAVNNVISGGTKIRESESCVSGYFVVQVELIRKGRLTGTYVRVSSISQTFHSLDKQTFPTPYIKWQRKHKRKRSELAL